MLDITTWFDTPDNIEEDYLTVLRAKEEDRKRIVYKIQHDLIGLARGLGQTQAQVRTKLEELFTTFSAEWALYILVGSDSLRTAIEADVTLSWLNVGVAGTSIRQRLVNRLS